MPKLFWMQEEVAGSRWSDRYRVADRSLVLVLGFRLAGKRILKRKIGRSVTYANGAVSACEGDYFFRFIWIIGRDVDKTGGFWGVEMSTTSVVSQLAK